MEYPAPQQHHTLFKYLSVTSTLNNLYPDDICFMADTKQKAADKIEHNATFSELQYSFGSAIQQPLFELSKELPIK
ncbi:hypothetical protein GCM10027043_15620 [Ferruginibacter profundus]